MEKLQKVIALDFDGTLDANQISYALFRLRRRLVDWVAERAREGRGKR